MEEIVPEYPCSDVDDDDEDTYNPVNDDEAEPDIGANKFKFCVPEINFHFRFLSDRLSGITNAKFRTFPT